MYNFIFRRQGIKNSIVGKKLVFFILIVFSEIGLFGQVFNIATENGNVISTCSGTFTDSEADFGYYANDEDYTVTFQAPAGSTFKIDFSSFELESYDALYIYDGPNIASPLIGAYSDFSLDGGSITSSGNSLTFNFKSNFEYNAPGWIATVSCNACPAIPAPVISSSKATACAGETITYSVVNHLGSTYNWTITNGTPASVAAGINTLDVTWDPAGGGLTGRVTVEEVAACGAKATSTLNVLIRRLPTPVISGLNDVCPGTAGVNYSTPLPVFPLLGPRNYLWTVVGGSVSGSGDNIDVNWGITGPGSVQLQETVIATGCSTTTPTYLVQIQDIIPPVISGCPSDIILNVAAGTCANTAIWIEPTAIDNCGGAMTYTTRSDAPGASFNSGTSAVIYTFTDAAGNTSTCTFNVIVNDNIDPVANCKDITVALGPGPLVNITGNDVDNGSTDNCGITGRNLSQSSFIAPGIYPVTLTVTDAAGNTDACISNVTVTANTPPNAVCKDITVYLDAAGSVLITGNDIDNGSNDPDGIVLWVASQTTFDCTDIGPNSVTLTVTDGAGQTASCTSIVTVTDNIAPALICPSNIIAGTDPGLCSAVVNYTAPVGTDNCAGSVTVQTAGLPSGSVFPVGTTTNIYRTTDASGNISTCSFTVTVNDNVGPVITLPAPPAIIAGPGCQAAIPVIAAAVTDNCTAAGSITVTQSPVAGTMVGTGVTIVTITATDLALNVNTSTINVTVTDATPPVITGAANNSAILNGSCQATVPDFLAGVTFTDDCTASGSIIKTQTPVLGTLVSGSSSTNILIEATDASGNKSSVTVIFTTIDNTPPSVICKNATIFLNGTGNATLAPGDIISSATDNCSASLSYALSQSAFTCADIGAPVSVTLTATDGSLNSGTCIAQVTVLDNIAPVVNVKTFNLVLNDITGIGTLLPADVDNVSTDNCGIATRTVAPNTFDCTDLGTQSVTLTITDSNGNSNSQAVNITVSSTLIINSAGPSSCNAFGPFSRFTSDVKFGSPPYTYFWDCIEPVNMFFYFPPFFVLSNTSTVAEPFFNNLVPDGLYNIQLTVTDSKGCIATYALLFNKVAGVVQDNITENNSAACINEIKSYTVAPGATSYVWTVENGTILAGGATNSVSVRWNGPTPGKITAQITKPDFFGNSCTSWVVENVTINANPSPVFTAFPPAACENSTVTYSLNSAYSSYSWVVTNGAVTAGGGAADNFVTVKWGASNPGTIVATVQNASGCSGSVTASITVNLLPSATITSNDADNTFCAGTSVTFTASVGSTNYQFRVNGTQVQNGAANTFITSGLTNGQIVDVVVTNAGGCVSTSAGITNTVVAFPTPTLTSSQQPANTFCSGTSVTFTAAGGTNFDFRVNGSSVQNSGSPVYTTSALTNGQVVDVIVSNGAGCSATSSGIINTVVAPPTAGLTSSDADNTFCAGTSVTFTATGGTTYNFRVASISVQNSASSTFTTTTLGNGQIVDVIVSNGTCTATSAGITNIVNPIPSATISSDAAGNSICAGTLITFTAGAGGTNYDFRVNGASKQNGVSNIYATNTIANGELVNVIVTGTGGCSTTSAGLVITVTTPPVVTINYPGSPYCSTTGAGQAVTLIGPSGGVYSAPAALSINAVTGVITPNASTPGGPYTVTYTLAAVGACPPTTATANVTITLVPTAGFIYSATPYCTTGADPSPTLNAGAITGTFTAFPAGLVFISPATGQIDLSASTPGTYTVTNTIAAYAGCGIVTASSPVTISLPPTAAINYSGTPFCTSVLTAQPVTLTGTGVYAGGAFTYTGAGTLSLNGATGAITPSTSTAGIYTVTYTLPSGPCASVPATTSVTITAAPSATISYGAIPNFCSNDPVVKTVTLTGTAGGTFSVSPAGLVINPGTGAITPVGSASGSYVVTYTIPAAAGCTAVNATANVNISASPTVNITYLGNPFCRSSAGIRAVSLSGTGSYTGGAYSVLPAGLTLNTTTGDISPSSSTAGIYTVTYTTLAAGGCSSVTATTSVTITALPVATISYAGNPFCNTIGGPQSVTITGTAGGIFTAAPAGLSINPATGDIIPSASTPATYTVTYTIPAAGGCANVIATTNVTITLLPTVTISYTGSPYCISSSPPQTVTINGTGNYLGGVFSADLPGLIIDPVSGLINPSASTPGSYVVTYQTLALGGCVAVSTTTNVAIAAPPVPTITGPNSVCINVPGNVYVTEPGQSIYTWSIIGGTITAGSGTNSVTVTWNIAGAQSISVNYTSPGGCTGVVPTVSTVTVNPLPSAITGTLNVCVGSTTTLGNANAGGSWTSASPAVATISPAGVVTGVTSGTSLITYTLPTGCLITATVTVNSNPTATIVPVLPQTCAGIPLPLTATALGGSGIYPGNVWSGPGATSLDDLNISTPTFTNGIAGNYALTYTVTDNRGCSGTANTTVIVNPIPSATISYAGAPFCNTVNTAQPVTITGATGGTFSATPAGLLSLDPVTGAIIPSTSSPATYTVTYTVPAAGGCSVFSTTTNVIITALPTVSIAYLTSPFCVMNGVPQTVTINGTAAYLGGTYSAGVGLTIDATSGAISPLTSTPNTYTVTYTTPASGGCVAVSTTASVTVSAVPTASISYSGQPYCASFASQPVSLSGTGAYTGGTFISFPAGLTIDGATGEVTPSTSIPGTYTVNYLTTAASGCVPVTASTTVTITVFPSALISYSGDPFCKSISGNIPVTITGSGVYTGGIYSSTAGLTIDPVTGAITPSASSDGTYTVTYTIPASGGCASVPVTTTVNITLVPTASISYAGDPFCTLPGGNIPVTIAGTGVYSGGTYTSSPAGLSIDGVTGTISPSASLPGIYTVTYLIPATGGCSTVSVNTTVNINELPTAVISYAGDPFCTTLVGNIPVILTGTGAYISGTYSSSAGLTINSATGEITPSSSTPGTYNIDYTIPASGGCGIVTASTVVNISEEPTAAISYSSPFCTSLMTDQSVIISGTGAYNGGTYSSVPAGLIIDTSDGDITPSASAAGVYTVSYTIPASGGCAPIPVTTTVTITAAPTAALSYAEPFCRSEVTDQPATLTGTGNYLGGSFASLAGLDLDATTGEINPANSTAGVYTVTYISSASGGCAPIIVSTNVSINEAPVAVISYAGTPFCSTTGAGQAVTLTGTSGGTYSSAPSGLNLDAVTGAINPSLSTPGNYDITYTIPASGGCALFSTTTTIAITALPTATIIYAGTPYCNSETAAIPVTFTGTPGGIFSAPAGLSLNTLTGDITPALSTPGIYTVDYTIAAVGGCLDVTASASVSIIAIPILVITDPSAVCAPSTVDLTAAGITAGSDASLTFTYWSDAAGTLSYATPSAATNGTYYIMGTNTLTGCSDIKPVTVNVNIIPVVITTDPPAVCSTITVDLTSVGITAGSDAGLIFSYWNDAAATIPYATPSAATAGIYYIMGTNTLTGCSDIKPVTVTVNPAPTVSFTQNNIVCNGIASGTIDITVSGGLAPYVYLWTGTGVVVGSEDQNSLTAGNYTVLVTDANSCTSVLLTVTITEPATALSATVTAQTPVSVFGGNDGSVTVDGSGGTSPYLYKIDAGSYQVSGSFTGLTAGAYNITVEDANLCTVIVPVLISGPPAPLGGTITQQTNVNCFGTATGSVTVAGTGGVTPYEYSLDAVTYQVSDTFGALVAGPYTVTVRDAALNIATVNVVITEPSSALTGTVSSAVDVLCFGSNTGSITVDGSGGAAPYRYKLGTGSYQVSGTFSTLIAGSYTVTVEDAGFCTFDVAVTITQPAEALAGTILAMSDVLCSGNASGSLSIAGSGGTGPYQYSLNGAPFQLSGVFSGLTAANYTIAVRDANSCSVNIPVTITEPAVLAVTSTVTDATCPGEPDGSITLSITGGKQPYNVIWLDGNITQVRTNIADGTYIAVITDANGCAVQINVVVNHTGSETCIEVPEIITPNNDGYNDTWKIKNIELFPDAEVFVYTRWGKLIFRTKNISANEWDGTSDGKLMPTDSYHYILRLNSGSEPRSGVISIIR